MRVTRTLWGRVYRPTATLLERLEAHCNATPRSMIVTPLPDEKRVNKVVFIGKNLNRQELTDGFKSCLEPAAVA
jgi:hypothetical protein